MKRFTINELKQQFELGVLENELDTLLRAIEQGDLQSQKELEKWQCKLDALKTKYNGSINEAVISLSNRRPELEEKFGIHPGQIYRITFDRDPTKYEGVLSEIIIHFDTLDSDFAIVRIELDEGVKSGVRYEFSREHVPREIKFDIPFDSVYLRRRNKIKTFEKLSGGK